MLSPGNAPGLSGRVYSLISSPLTTVVVCAVAGTMFVRLNSYRKDKWSVSGFRTYTFPAPLLGSNQWHQ